MKNNNESCVLFCLIGWVCAADIFSLVCCTYCFACLVLCLVPGIGDVSGLSIFGHPFGNLVAKHI